MAIPAGSGKSASALLLAKLSGARTIILTATKGLQNQYIRDIAPIGGVSVTGQNNFPCLLSRNLRADEGSCHDGIVCKLKEQCPYRLQLKRALASRLIVTNYAYWLAQTNFSQGLGDVNLIIADEGHQAFSAMENYLTISISRMDVQSLGISFPETADDLWGAWKTWAGVAAPIAAACIADLDAQIREQEGNGQPVPLSITRSYRTIKATAAKLTRLATVSEQWVIERTSHGYQFVPKWVANYVSHLFAKTPKVVLMSAVLSPRSVDYLGVPSNGDRTWIETDSSFPPQNTQIWHIPTARINYHTDDYGSAVWVSRIDQIIQRRLDRKGIVFTVSYERARLLLSRSHFKDIMLTHSTGDVVQVVEKFKRMDAPVVLVSPTVTTGWDFPMLESGHGRPQYGIIGKLPYPDSQNLVTKARNEDDKEWTSYLAMETLVQSAGRFSRTPDDLAEIFIVDDSIKWFMKLYSHFAPLYFRKRYRGSKDFVPDPLL
jgi:Rad3-related DNA helicase